jgi:hypothetical protein
MDSKQELDVAIEWAEKLALEIVPDEIDRVPFVVEGFVKDEKARKKLLQQSKGNTLGGFGIEGYALLPWIFKAMSVSTPFLGGLLTSRTIASFLVIINEIKALLAARNQKPQERIKFEITDPLAQQSAVSLAQTLRGAGLSAEKSEVLAYEVLAFLLQDPTNAVLFLQKITERK